MRFDRLACVALVSLCALPAPWLRANGPFSQAFTYQGQLTLAGEPYTGQVTLRARLWDAATDGAQIGSEIELTNVNVEAGVFSVVLNAESQFGPSAFAGGPRHLELRVRRAGETSFSTIQPRFVLRSTPFASTAGAIGSRTSSTPLLNVDTTDRIGVGTATPQAKLDLKGNLYVDHRGWGETPTLPLALGDSDTGLDSPSDGALSLVSNTRPFFRIEPGNAIVIAGRDGASNGVGGTLSAESIRLTAGNHFDGFFGDSSGGRITLRHGTGLPGGTFVPGIPSGDVLVTVDSGNALLRIDAPGDNTSAIDFFDAGVARWGFGRDPSNRLYIDEAGVARRFTMNQIAGAAFGAAAPTPGFVLDVQGLLRCVGILNASSIRYKHDIEPLGSVLDQVALLRPVSFTWNDSPEHGLGDMAGRRDVGLIAEEVATIFPDAVSRSEGRIEGINVPSLTAYTVQAIKDQRELLLEKDRQISDLTARLERLERLLGERKD